MISAANMLCWPGLMLAFVRYGIALLDYHWTVSSAGPHTPAALVVFYRLQTRRSSLERWSILADWPTGIR